MKKLYPIISLFLIIFAGCNPQKSLFYWGNYSSTLYNYKKDPSEKNMKLHKATLTNIITESQNKNKLIPPGVFAEYGFICLQEGNAKEANEYFDEEIKAYPESKVFIAKLKSETKAGEKK
jgi:hypothetical protein